MQETIRQETEKQIPKSIFADVIDPETGEKCKLEIKYSDDMKPTEAFLYNQESQLIKYANIAKIAEINPKEIKNEETLKKILEYLRTQGKKEEGIGPLNL